jgi:hypothetical protein
LSWEERSLEMEEKFKNDNKQLKEFEKVAGKR